MSRYVYDADGQVIEFWDDVTRTYTDYSTDPDTVRPYTAEENAAADAEEAAATEESNRVSIETKAQQGIDSNNTFLALEAPTNAQSLAQIRSLTRQANGLIRLALGRFEIDDA